MERKKDIFSCCTKWHFHTWQRSVILDRSEISLETRLDFRGQVMAQPTKQGYNEIMV
jgi:hypothetical protein